MIRRPCLALLLASLALLPALAPANSTTSPNAKPPRICLVLSGGGARGAAHVGVLRVLEELRVPVHCIAGTSMGSLVGAAYATGTTLAEMDEILASISTELLFKEEPPRQERHMRRKQDDYSILFTPEVGLHQGELKLGKGIVTGVQLETVLRQLSKSKGFLQFDQLPIPYRAVATDLVTGKAVVFQEGELANVMRASMSVPGAVAPAVIDDMLLVDGMLTHNLPVQVARDMGADVIIAVNVGTPLLKREQLNGILGVSGQMLSILTEQNVQASMASLQPQDILISPALGDYSTGDFDALPQIAPLGENATRQLAERLRPLALPPAEYAALRQQQTRQSQPQRLIVDVIRFDNLQRVNPQALVGLVDTRVGQPIDQATLDKDIRRIYGTGDFEHVSYQLLEEQDKRVLAIKAAEKTWGPDYLRFGLGLASDFDGDSSFTLLASHRQTWLNQRGAEWRNDVQFGQVNSLNSEWYQPLSAGNPLFLAPHLSITQRSTDLYTKDRRLGTYDMLSTLAGLDIGSQFSRYGELRLGLLAGQRRTSLDSGPDYLEVEDERLQVGALTARLRLDQLDSANFPRAGWRAQLNLFDSQPALGAEENYAKWSGEFSQAVSFDTHTFNFALFSAQRLGDRPLPNYDHIQWGGFLKQSGYAPGQLLGQDLQFGRFMYYHRIMQGTLLEGAYGGFSLEMGRMREPLIQGNDDDWILSSSLFIGTDTPIGPLYLGYGRADTGSSSLYFYLGRPF